MAVHRIVEVFGRLPNRPDQAAHAFARSGIPVFPCMPSQKVPFKGSRGLLDATTDLRQVAQWWRWCPNANIAIPTGTTSRVVVVDVDVHSVDGYAAFRRARHEGLLPAPLAVIRTPTGGMHLYYPAAADSDERSWQAAKAGIDLRGNGGYVIVPPSRLRVHRVHRPWEVHVLSADDIEPVDAALLREFLRPRRPLRASSHSVRPARPGDVARITAFVGTLVEGERNSGLFWAACRLVERGLSPEETLDALSPPAEAVGLPGWEVETTVRSAYRTAQAAPARLVHGLRSDVRREARASPTARGLA